MVCFFGVAIYTLRNVLSRTSATSELRGMAVVARHLTASFVSPHHYDLGFGFILWVTAVEAGIRTLNNGM